MDKLDFPIFSANWSAREELLLIQGLMKSGMDNWIDIAEKVGSKTPDECESHYYCFYYKSKQDSQPEV